MTTLLFVILSLAVARITQLITEDYLPIVAKPRDWITARKPHGNLAYLIGCWWCTSVYVAAGAAAFAIWVLDVPGDWREFLLYWPALSMSGVMLQGAADWLTNMPERD